MRQRPRHSVYESRWLTGLVGLLAAMSLGAREAAAEVLTFITPFAEARASDMPSSGAQVPDIDWKMDADFGLPDLAPVPKYAFAASGGATAQSSATLIEGAKVRFGLVAARSTSANGTALGQAMTIVKVVDPQNRPQV